MDQPDSLTAERDGFGQMGEFGHRPLDIGNFARQALAANSNRDIALGHSRGIVDAIADKQNRLSLLSLFPHDREFLLRCQPRKQLGQGKIRRSGRAIARNENALDAHFFEFVNRFGDKRPLRFTKQNGSGPLAIYFDGETMVRTVQNIASSRNAYGVERARCGFDFRQNSQSRLNTYGTGRKTFVRARGRSAFAMGCSTALSAAEISSSTKVRRSRHAGSSRSSGVASGSVKVPVLSKATQFTEANFSIVFPDVTTMPNAFKRRMAVQMATGVAKPRAHGQATRSTAMALNKPCRPAVEKGVNAKCQQRRAATKGTNHCMMRLAAS